MAKSTVSRTRTSKTTIIPAGITPAKTLPKPVHPFSFVVPYHLLPQVMASPELKEKRVMVYGVSEDHDCHATDRNRWEATMAKIRTLGQSEMIIDIKSEKALNNLVHELDSNLIENFVGALLKKAAQYNMLIKNDVLWPCNPQWEEVEAPDEATEPIDVRMIKKQTGPIRWLPSDDEAPAVEGEFISSTPATDYLEPEYRKGEPVILRAGSTAADGDIVLAEVYTQLKSKSRWADENPCSTVLRRYSTDPKTGNSILSALKVNVPTIREGRTSSGDIIHVEVQGVATNFKASWTQTRTVGKCVVCEV